MARNFDLNKLPMEDVSTEVTETSFPSTKRKVPELESWGLDQAAKRALKVVDLEMFIAESVYTVPPTYAARTGARPRPAGFVPYQPPARYAMQGSGTGNPATAQSSSNQGWASVSSPLLHDMESSITEPAPKRIG